jgi:uncharacterized protein
MKILVAGATGFIGPTLIHELAGRGNEIVALSRSPREQSGSFPPSVIMDRWDGRTQGKWCRHLETVDAVINLAGASIAGGRWTDRRKQLIVDSRVEATRSIVRAIRESKRSPGVLINASAVGYYGTTGSGPVTEETPPGNDFLAKTCIMWEREALEAHSAETRVVLPRLGVVLAKDGGALQKMLIPFRFFIGGPLGSGTQWYPWIHRDDVVGAFIHCIEHPDIAGPVNVVAPESVTMADFVRELGKVMDRPSWLPVPGGMLRLVLGEMAAMILEGRKVVPERLIRSGFVYRYGGLREALEAVVR